MFETRFILNDDNFSKIDIVRNGEKIKLNKSTSKYSMIGFNYYYDNGNLEINGIKNGDIILVQYKDITYVYKYLENNGRRLVNINLNDIKVFEKIKDDIYNINLSLDKDFFNIHYINGDIDKFNEIYLNDVKFEKTVNHYLIQNQYYKDNRVKIALNDKDVITFKKDGKIIGIYRFNKDKLEAVKEVKSDAEENSIIPNIPAVKEDIKNNTSTLVKINKITEKFESFDNYLKIEPKEAVKSIDGINLNGNNLKL